jgi:hypothetical protein
LARIFYHLQRRRRLVRLRATMIGMGRDPGDLLTPRAYRRLLRGLHLVKVSLATFGCSAQTAETAMREFGMAYRVALTQQKRAP